MNTGEILIRLLEFGLVLYLALAADQVLYREGTTRDRPWIRLIVYFLVGLVSFLFFHSIQEETRNRAQRTPITQRDISPIVSFSSASALTE